MDEVGRDDAAGLRGKELLPGRAGAAWCGVDPGGMQDLPHRGCCDRMAELDEFALHRRCLHSPGNVDSLWPGGRRHGRCCGLLAGGRACALCWCRTSWRPACDARPAASPASRERCRPSARGVSAAPARRTTPGQPARTVSARRAAAAPCSRAGVPAAQHPWPGPCGMPGLRGQVSGEPAPGQPTITASRPQVKAQLSQTIEYSSGTRST